MAIATRTTSVLASTITQQSLYNALKTAFTAAGFGNPYDEYTNPDGSLRIAWQIVLDSTKTYGTSYVRFRVGTDLVVGFLAAATWDKVAHTSSVLSSEIASTAFAVGANISIESLNGGNELKCVILTQGTIFLPLCFLSPFNKPTWWDLNTYPYAFIATINTFATFGTTTLNPYSNALNSSSLNNTRLSGVNPINSKRDIELGVMLYNNSNNGIAGKTSDDIVSLAAGSTTRYDIIRVIGTPTKEYLILTNAAGGLGVRIL